MTAVYLAAIVAANLSVAAVGPAASILNAFLFIGLDQPRERKKRPDWLGCERAR
jgi:hypothetical protein